MVENLTDDALDIIIDIVQATSQRLYGNLMEARHYWLYITTDYYQEWCDRGACLSEREGERNATIEA